jgi:hypothetical protein
MKIGKVAEDENKYVGIFRIKKRFPKLEHESVAGFLQLLGLFLKHTQKNLRALQDFGIGVLGLVDRLVVLKRKIRAR